MVWKAVNHPIDIPAACGEAVSLSLQGLTPSRREGGAGLLSDLGGFWVLWSLELELQKPCEKVGS